jgi:hypothetical protein
MEIQIMITFEFVCAWNTGRLYQKDGQRIACWRVLLDGKLEAYFMNDDSRGIDYFFAPMPESPWHHEAREIRRYVMECYDYNKGVVYPYMFAKEQDHLLTEKAKAVKSMYQGMVFEKWSPIYL